MEQQEKYLTEVTEEPNPTVAIKEKEWDCPACGAPLGTSYRDAAIHIKRIRVIDEATNVHTIIYGQSWCASCGEITPINISDEAFRELVHSVSRERRAKWLGIISECFESSGK